MFLFLSTNFFTSSSFVWLDAAEPWQFGFQSAVTPVMEGIINFHNYIMLFFICILFFIIIWGFLRIFIPSFPLKSFLQTSLVVLGILFFFSYTKEIFQAYESTNALSLSAFLPFVLMCLVPIFTKRVTIFFSIKNENFSRFIRFLFHLFFVMLFSVLANGSVNCMQNFLAGHHGQADDIRQALNPDVAVGGEAIAEGGGFEQFIFGGSVVPAHQPADSVAISVGDMDRAITSSNEEWERHAEHFSNVDASFSQESIGSNSADSKLSDGEESRPVSPQSTTSLGRTHFEPNFEGDELIRGDLVIEIQNPIVERVALNLTYRVGFGAFILGTIGSLFGFTGPIILFSTLLIGGSDYLLTEYMSYRSAGLANAAAPVAVENTVLAPASNNPVVAERINLPTLPNSISNGVTGFTNAGSIPNYPRILP
jgi:hypothetical protein